MKTLENDELYRHLQGFLKAKGVELQSGSYSQKIQKGCGLLSDVINVSQRGVNRAKVEIDKKLEQIRQVIHEKTAPPGPAAPPPAAESKANKRSSSAPRRKARKHKKRPA